MSPEELKRVWLAADGDQSWTGHAVKMMVLTAQRVGELRKMRWQDIDWEEAWWVIPAEHSKNGLSHRVPLTPSAIKLLSELHRKRQDNEWVFPRLGGGGPVQNIQKLMGRIRKRGGLEDFQARDIRRSVASQIASMGTQRIVISKILNHVETGITAVYERHSYDQEKRQALDAWGRKFRQTLDGKKEGNIVNFSR